MPMMSRVLVWLRRWIVRLAWRDALPDGLTYRAFLSYSSVDTCQARRLHRSLERYRVPWRLVGESSDHGTIPRRLRPIFRDRDDAAAATSVESLLEAELAHSQHLVVLCTPASAASGFVNNEIAAFRRLRPGAPIHAVIGAGQPPGCFPPALLVTSTGGDAREPLAADLRTEGSGGDGWRKGKLKLIAGIIGVSFDLLWLRERRRRIWRLITATAGTAVILAIAMTGSRQYRQALLQQARIECASPAPGSRTSGLAALERASWFGRTDELRFAYVDCLLRPGLDEVGTHYDVQVPAAQLTVVAHEAAGVRATVRRSGQAGTIEVSTERNGAPLATWSLRADDSDSVRVSPDGTHVAVVFYSPSLSTPARIVSQQLIIFDSRTGDALCQALPVDDEGFGHRSNSLRRLSFDGTGRYLAAAGISGWITAWDLMSAQGPVVSLHVRPFEGVQAVAAAVSPDGRWVAATADDGALAVVGMETNEVVARTTLGPQLHVSESVRSVALSIEWPREDTIRVGPLEWRWSSPLDTEIWATSNQRRRTINQVSFDRAGERVAFVSDYGGVPYVIPAIPPLSIWRGVLGRDFWIDQKQVVFGAADTAACATDFSSLSCWDLIDGRKIVVGEPAGRHRYRALGSDGKSLVAAGDEESVVLEALDANGKTAWQQAKAAAGEIDVLIDGAGQQVAYRGEAQQTMFETLRLTDGASLRVVTEASDHERDWLVSLDDGFVLAHPMGGGLHEVADAAQNLRLPDPQKSPPNAAALPPIVRRPPIFTQLAVSPDGSFVQRTPTGFVTFRERSMDSCNPTLFKEPRNPIMALSDAGRRVAAFDGDALKVWDTATCEATEIAGTADVSAMAFGTDGRTLHYRTSGGLETRRFAQPPVTVPLKTPVGCYITSRGFSVSQSAYWEACVGESREVSIRAWDLRDGRLRIDQTFSRPRLEFAKVAISPDLSRIVVAYTTKQGRVWSWASSPAEKAASRCPSIRFGAGPSLSLSSDGRWAGWLDREPPQNIRLTPVERVHVVALDSCAVTTMTRQSSTPVALTGLTTTGVAVIESRESVEALGPDGRPIWRSLTSAGPIMRAAIAPDGQWVVAALDGGRMAMARRGEAAPRLVWSFRGANVTALTVLRTRPRSGRGDGRWRSEGLVDGGSR
jgi:WD40 repeat protein